MQSRTRNRASVSPPPSPSSSASSCLSRRSPGSFRRDEYDRVKNEALGKDVPVPGTYHQVEANPQRLLKSVLMAPIEGMYDPGNG